jgi:hypothetical protein
LRQRGYSNYEPIFALSGLLLSIFLCRADMRKLIPPWPDGAPGSPGTNDWDIPTVTPSKVWCFAPARMPAVNFSIAAGWTPSDA